MFIDEGCNSDNQLNKFVSLKLRFFSALVKEFHDDCFTDLERRLLRFVDTYLTDYPTFFCQMNEIFGCERRVTMRLTTIK